MTIHCPLCGLRFNRASELDLHAREDHAPRSEPRVEKLVVPKGREPEDGPRPEVIKGAW